ncbi:hypothetical protein N9294_02660 [bacterium]|jgi:hypothetical protein|nr:hypothetical protein [Akkermansiaceae bacterium]MDB4382994.1 hypothetical protein [Akkermansiaceae bacterium]MDB4422842.1 hypothetical protein [bacterium]
MIPAFHAGDWAAVTIMIIILVGAIAGMVKFIQCIVVLKKGPPAVDPELAKKQEQEFQNHEQDD